LILLCPSFKSRHFFFCLQKDLNKDHRLDLNEFRTLINQNLGPNASIYTGNIGDGGKYSGSYYGTSSSSAYADGSNGIGGYNGGTDLAGANINGAGNIDGNPSYSSYEQASFASSTGGGPGGFDASVASAVDITGVTTGESSSSTFETGSNQQQVQQYATNAQGLYQDPNPQIIRRPAQSEQITYTQNIKIRFLQPPAIPPPGVSSFLTNMTFILLLILATYYQRSASTATTTTTTAGCPSTCSTSSYTTSTYLT